MTRFKQLLEDKKVSNEDAAIMFDKTVRTISRWKSGEVKAPKLVILALENIEMYKVAKAS